MNFLQLYLYANIYILFFWVFYRFFLQKVYAFQSLRFYILSTFILALVMPVFQHSLTLFFNSNQSFLNSGSLQKFVYLTSTLSEGRSNIVTGPNSLDPHAAIRIIVFSGGLFTMLRLIYLHIRINKLISSSKRTISQANKILLCKEEIVPFLYNNSIIISDSVPPAERDLIIRHESLHYKLAHQVDNLLIQLFQIIFWLNPFFYLLKRELIQVHEYQVDNLVISSGANPVEYKFVLIKNTAGHQKFAVANGLKNSKIKKRIIMMNTIISKKGKWKFFLLIPAVSFIFLSLSCTNIRPAEIPEAAVSPLPAIREIDSVKIEIVTLPEDFKIDQDEAIIVLINKISDVAIEGRLVPATQRVTTIVREYEKNREERFFKNLKPQAKIIIQKDRNTNEEDYKALLDEISTALYTLHESYSKSIFDKAFKSLNKEEQAKILEIIPPKIYLATPKQVKW